MPTTDLQVLHVLTRQGGVLRRYSTLTTVLESDAEPATVNRGETVVNAAGNVTRIKKVGIGLTVVSAIVKALGGDAGIEASVSSGSAVDFSYTHVVADRVDLGTLDKWLAGADFAPASHHSADLLASEEVYVVVAALKASGVAVGVVDKQGQAIALDVPAIQQVVGAKVEVARSTESAHTLTFRGQTAVTVGAKVAQLKFDEDGFWVNERLTVKGEIRSLAGSGGASYLDGPVLRLG